MLFRSEQCEHLERRLEQIKLTNQLSDRIFKELNVIDKQVNESTANTHFSILIQCLKYLEEQIQTEFPDENCELKSK